MLYFYAVFERPELSLTSGDRQDIDMENLDYKRQPVPAAVRQALEAGNGTVLGIWRGGMFGLATNQISSLSVWEDLPAAQSAHQKAAKESSNTLNMQYPCEATVRPAKPEKIARDGFYVIRWIRMATNDIPEYTRLCLETWPAFQAAGTANCYGVFRPLTREKISKLLMLTWYSSMEQWEETRALDTADKQKWARRSEMELSHWADAGRLALA